MKQFFTNPSIPFFKKITVFNFFYKCMVIAFFLSFFSSSAIAGAGFFKQFVVIDRGTNGNEYFGNGLSNFAINLGTFCQNGTFILRGAEANTFQSGNDQVECNVFCPRMWYRIYPTSNPSGGFTAVGMFFRNVAGNGDKKWDVLDANINLLNGLSAGNYTMEVYFQGNAIYPGPPAGNFDFFDSNGGNNYKATFSVRSNPSIAGISAGLNPICVSNTTSLTANVVGGDGASLNWYTGPDGTGSNLGSSNPLTDRAPGTYYARVTGTCTPAAEASFTINSTPAPTWYKDADNDGYSDGTTLSQCTQPANYKLATNLTAISGDCNDNNAAINPAGISCLDGSITGATSVTCFSDFAVKLTAAGLGGQAPFSYLWSTGQSGAVLNNAGAGNYSVTITDAIGQTKVVNHSITQPTAVSATLVITNQKCEDPAKGTIVATGSGGTPGYQYALNFGPWQNSGTFMMVSPGRHIVNIKDINGCQGKVNALVTKLASSMTLSAVRTGISSCGGTGTITATAGGGVAPYQYKLGEAGTYQSSGTFSGLAAGTYSIFAKDNIGCTVKRNYTVVDNGKDAFEPNNDRSRANTIIVSQPVVARIGTATDQDWFKFNSGSGGDFDITLAHGTVNYNLQLFTNLGALVTPVSQTGNTISYTGLEFASTYRIQITGAQSFDCYNLMVAPAPPVITGAEMLTSTTVAPDELKAKAFPNPHNGSFIFQVESPVTGKGSIVLYDLQGRTMVTREENLRAGTNQVRFSNLQPINYFYRVMVGGKSTSGKVFKQ